MGILDIFSGSGPDKALKLRSKVTQKYGDAATRQKALSQLGEMKFPEAVEVLLARFTISVDPQTTDAEEKEHTFQLVKAFGDSALEPVKAFLVRSDQATSWAVRLLEALLPGPEVIAVCTSTLERFSKEYARTHEKKVVLLNFLEGKDDPRIAPAAVPFLEDTADDVKIAALRLLGPLRHEPAREGMLHLLVGEETARRVQTAAIAALSESGFGVQGFRERVEQLVSEPYFVDKSGVIKKRS